MFKNYIKLTFKVMMRRKMFTFINLFGICFSLTIFLTATTVYTLMVVSNPVQKNLSKFLFLKQVTLRDPEKQSMSSGPAMPYFIEKCIKPLKNGVTRYFICSVRSIPVTVYLNNQRIDIDTRATDENYWKMNTFQFVEGRPYDAKEIQSNLNLVVICRSLKERIFGKSQAIGKIITLGNINYRIVGVVNDVAAIYQPAYAQIWYPYSYAAYQRQVRDKDYSTWVYQVCVETNSIKSMEVVRKQFKQEVARLKPPEHYKVIEANLESSSEIVSKTINDRKQGRVLLIALVLLFSLLPILNLTNLTVSRIFERSSEIGVRKAFGATKPRMIMQFVSENIIITIIGGILGFIGAWLLLKGIDASDLIQLGKVDFSLQVFIYGLCVVMIFGIISGLYPAFKMSKLQIIDCLKGGNK